MLLPPIVPSPKQAVSISCLARACQSSTDVLRCYEKLKGCCRPRRGSRGDSSGIQRAAEQRQREQRLRCSGSGGGWQLGFNAHHAFLDEMVDGAGLVAQAGQQFAAVLTQARRVAAQTQAGTVQAQR